MGSKAKHAKEIIQTIENELGGFLFNWESYNKDYVEPFVGGANMIDKIPKIFKTIRGNNINVPLIKMFQAVQNGWIPPDTISENQYKELMNKRNNYNDDEAALVGFVGIGCSFSGKWFGGYARSKFHYGIERNYCLESKNNLLKQDIKHIFFTYGNYYDLTFNNESLIYCDPPYFETTKYQSSFDHNRFWKWCNERIADGHKVFVSEFVAPKDWKCIWQKKANDYFMKKNTKSIEKLFTK